MKGKNKLIVSIIIVLILQVVLPLCSFLDLNIFSKVYAEELTTDDGNFEYTILDDGTVEITDYIGKDT